MRLYIPAKISSIITPTPPLRYSILRIPNGLKISNRRNSANAARAYHKLPAGAAKAARAAIGRIERVRLRKLRRQKRQDHELGDAVAGGDGARLVRIVVQRDGALAAVVGIDHTDAVGRAQPLPGGQPAAREHAAEIPRRDGEGEPRADHGRRVRRDGDALPVRRAGIEIVAGGVRTAAAGRHGAGVQFLNLYFHPFMPSQSTMRPAARVRSMSMMRWFSEPRKRRLMLRCAST